jgi:hypothetical protein
MTSRPDEVFSIGRVCCWRTNFEGYLGLGLSVACHAISYHEEPFESHLLLCETDRTQKAMPATLSVRDLLNHRSPKADLAYISACSSAATSVLTLAHENIHIFPMASNWRLDSKTLLRVYCSKKMMSRIKSKHKIRSPNSLITIREIVCLNRGKQC